MSQSETPIVWSVFLSRPRNATACSGERRSGSVTISTSGVPQRLKSTTEESAPAMRPPVPPACTSLAASSSMWARVMPTRPPSTSRSPVDADRLVVLADLVRLGAVGIEVVLAVKLAALGDVAVEREADLDRLLDRARVDRRQRPGMAQADAGR